MLNVLRVLQKLPRRHSWIWFRMRSWSQRAVESHRALDVFSRLSNATPDTFETLKKDARLHYLTGYRSD